jgi:GNAT superfamily N-acetyltransferase
MTVREATVDDVDVVLEHRRHMFADMGLGDAESRDAMVAASRPYLLAAIREGSYRGWLAEVDGRVVAGGGIVIATFPPLPWELQPRRASILNVYTEPACRRRGLARRLLERMVQWCRDEGFASVSLHASQDGRPLYEALGFTPTNELRLHLR